MPFCVKCGYEYLPGIKRCPECGAELVDRVREETHEPADRFVRVWESPDEITAMSVKSALEGAGIPTVEEVQRSWAYDGIDLSMRGVYSVFLVPESRAKEARELIEEYLRGRPSEQSALDEDAAEDIDD